MTDKELMAIEGRFRSIGYDEGLGRMWGVYPAFIVPASRFWAAGITAGVFAAAGLAMLATSVFAAVVLFVIAAVFAVRIWYGLKMNRVGAGMAIATFESGMVVMAGRQRPTVLHWRTASARQQRFVEHRRNGALARTADRYNVTGPGGVDLTLTGGLVNPQKWGREIRDGIIRAQLPHALQTVAGGNGLHFGPIYVDRRVVWAGGRSVPWSDVERIKVTKGEVSVRVAGKWLTLVRTDVSRIRDIFVFYALAEALRTSAVSG